MTPSPEERAKRIAGQFFPIEHRPDAESAIADALKAYGDERLEDAAKVAEKHGVDHSDEADRLEKEPDEHFASIRTKSDMVASLAHTSMECDCIATAIRALKSQP